MSSFNYLLIVDGKSYPFEAAAAVEMGILAAQEADARDIAVFALDELDIEVFMA